VYATLACGQLSLANAGFMAMGGYASALLTTKLPEVPFPLVLAASAIVPAVVALPLGLPVLRLRGVFLAIATIGFGEVVRLALVNWDYTNGALGIVAIPERAGIVSIFASLAFVLFVFWRLRGSKIGYALESIREDEPAARTMGINTTAHKLAMFVFGGAIAGLAGGLEAHITFMVAPAGYGFGRVVDMLVYAIVGGIAHFFGPAIGASFLTLLPELLRELSRLTGVQAGPLRMFVNGAVLLVVIIFLPNGLVSLPGRIRQWRSERRERGAAVR
jgi:branched-chain amino acid transport system permease protein